MQYHRREECARQLRDGGGGGGGGGGDYNHSTGQCYIGLSVDALSGLVEYRIVRWCILHMCTNIRICHTTA